jgi:hypothetical protein
VSVDHGLQGGDLSIWAPCRTVTNPHQAQDAEGRIDRSPLLDDPAEEIAGEQWRGGALRTDERKEHFEAVIHAKPLGGEGFATGE